MSNNSAADREFARYFENPEILFWKAGDKVANGPIAVTGYYVSPFCHWGCCRPVGPFESFDEALNVSRENWRNWFADEPR